MPEWVLLVMVALAGGGLGSIGMVLLGLYNSKKTQLTEDRKLEMKEHDDVVSHFKVLTDAYAARFAVMNDRIDINDKSIVELKACVENYEAKIEELEEIVKRQQKVIEAQEKEINELKAINETYLKRIRKLEAINNGKETTEVQNSQAPSF